MFSALPPDGGPCAVQSACPFRAMYPLPRRHAYLCAATHDYRDPSFPILAPGIVIGAECWIGARAFVGPGVSAQKGAVVAACAVVVSNIAEGTVVAGCPARNLGFRKSGAAYGKPVRSG